MTIGKGRFVTDFDRDEGENYYGLLKAEVYCLRVYGKCFTDSQVIDSFEKTKDYHNLLMNNN